MKVYIEKYKKHEAHHRETVRKKKTWTPKDERDKVEQILEEEINEVDVVKCGSIVMHDKR